MRISPVVVGCWLLLAACATPVEAQMSREFAARMFGNFDRNRNGEVELDELPDPMRDYLRSRNIRSLDRDEFADVAPRMFAEMRRQREESGGGFGGRGGFRGFRGRGDDDDDDDRGRDYRSRYRRGDDDRDDDRDRDRDRSSGSRSKTTNWSPPKRARVTLDLQEKYLPVDVDRDGQVGLYEWKQQRRGELAAFFQYDANGDGFLTPKELALVEAGKVPVPAPSSLAGATIPARPSTASPGLAAKPVPSPTGTVNMPGNNEPPAEESAETKRAHSIFKLLDRDSDDAVSPEEWEKSRTIRRMFDEAEIDLGRPMPREQFVANYVRVIASGN